MKAHKKKVTLSSMIRKLPKSTKQKRQEAEEQIANFRELLSVYKTTTLELERQLAAEKSKNAELQAKLHAYENYAIGVENYDSWIHQMAWEPGMPKGAEPE